MQTVTLTERIETLSPESVECLVYRLLKSHSFHFFDTSFKLKAFTSSSIFFVHNNAAFSLQKKAFKLNGSASRVYPHYDRYSLCDHASDKAEKSEVYRKKINFSKCGTSGMKC